MVNSEEERGKHKPVSPVTQQRPPERPRTPYLPQPPTHLYLLLRRQRLTWQSRGTVGVGASLRVSLLPRSGLSAQPQVGGWPEW